MDATVKNTINRFRFLSEKYRIGHRDTDYIMSDLIKKGLILANEISPLDNVTVKCDPGSLDDVKIHYADIGYEMDYFSIGKGKAKYHYFTLAENSCGLYYAWRVLKDGSVGFRRAVEPLQDIFIHFILR